MSLFEKSIPVKGKFVKETRGYREADVQEFIRNIKKELADPRLDRWSADKLIEYHAGAELVQKTSRGIEE